MNLPGNTFRPWAPFLTIALVLAACGAQATPSSTGRPTPEPSPTRRAEHSGVSNPTTEAAGAGRSTSDGDTLHPVRSDIDQLAGQAMSFLDRLTSQFSPRQSGTEEESRAAQYLASEFRSLGYDTTLEPFPVEVPWSRVALGPADAVPNLEFSTLPITGSVEGTPVGDVVWVRKALTQELPAGGLEGKIALIERGAITFQEKVNRVAEAGAAGALIFNNREGRFRGAFKSPPPIPAVSMSREDGLAIVDLLEEGELKAVLTVGVRKYESQNVVARKPGVSDGGTVVIGGHYDTVEGVSGANDNGSGTATVQTVAWAVADASYPFDIRFVLFGAEELGLHGSVNHVKVMDSEGLDEIIAMFNFDALGTGETLEALGDRALLDAALEVAEEAKVPARRRFDLDQASSDHAPFEAAGIPVVFFLGDDVTRIHTPEDTLEHIDPGLMGGAAAIAIGLLDILGER